MRVMSGPGPLSANLVAAAAVEDSVLTDLSLDQAERRHVRTEDVSLSWQIDWKAERLDICLFGKPENRAFQVHLVVKETVYSGEKLSNNIRNPFKDPQRLWPPLIKMDETVRKKIDVLFRGNREMTLSMNH
jgi:hypothetical protein